MKLLRISASGLPLFNKPCVIDFLATQRVSTESAEKLSCLFSTANQRFYLNNVLSFIGINASGKTTVLKLIAFVCKLIGNESLNSISYKDILDGVEEGAEVVFDTYFYTEGAVHFLHTVVGRTDRKLVIRDEVLKTRAAGRIKSKTDIFSFDDCSPALTRDRDEAYLLDDVSIMVAFNKRAADPLAVTDMLQYTNVNQLSITEDCPPELIAFFDPGVEYLHVRGEGKDTDIRLKFKGKEELVLNQFSELNRYLSSGTIKGINIFLKAVRSFEIGGYLIVDELENHFNHEIVSTLIRFYLDKRINANSAVMIFSTHYAEILDEFERNDSIYIVRNRDGITAENLSTILRRNDIKKSVAYESGFLEGTVPMYDAYMALKKSILRAREGE